MKIKLFTHTDLDGVGCAIVAKNAFAEVDVEYCNYDDIDTKIQEYISYKEYIDYAETFITDISVNEMSADLINYIYSNGNKIKLIDHHSTAKWLNQYKWAYVDDLEISIYPNEETMKSSGTSLFYNYLWENSILNCPPLIEFVELVRRYDTWEWHTKFNDLNAKQLNDLYYIIGREKFVERFVNEPNPKFKESESMILEIEQSKIDSYINRKSKQMFKQEFDEHNVGVVFAEQYISQLGNVLATNNPHLDFIVMIDVGNNSVSYRGIHKHIDLGVIAKKYGGGGHPSAAGSRTDEDIKKDLWTDFVVNYA